MWLSVQRLILKKIRCSCRQPSSRDSLSPRVFSRTGSSCCIRRWQKANPATDNEVKCKSLTVHFYIRQKKLQITVWTFYAKPPHTACFPLHAKPLKWSRDYKYILFAPVGRDMLVHNWNSNKQSTATQIHSTIALFSSATSIYATRRGHGMGLIPRPMLIIFERDGWRWFKSPPPPHTHTHTAPHRLLHTTYKHRPQCPPVWHDVLYSANYTVSTGIGFSIYPCKIFRKASRTI